MKRIISALLVLLMLVSLVPTTVFADDTVNQSTVNDDTNATITEDGGLGGLIANSLEEQEAAEADKDVDIENKILEVQVEGKKATVAFNNAVECNIIVAIYDETTNAMVGSGMGSFAEHTELAEIEIDVEEMPEYFVIKAYLLDTKNNPLHTSYESIEYTQAHQEFLATTIHNFDSDQIVINYDESEDNNFGVFNETTVLIYESETVNIKGVVDVDSHTYSFINADADLKTLHIGDVFYYIALDGNDIAGKVASIAVTDDTVTIISEDDVALDEVFSFMKIDTVSDGYNSVFDTSSADEGIIYEGAYDISTYAGVDVSAGLKHGFSIDKKFGDADDGGGEVKIEGTLTLGVNLDLEIELYWNRFYAEVSLKEELGLSVEVTGKISSTPIKVGTLKIPTGVPSVTIETNVNFVVEFSVQLKFEATQEATIGFEYDTDSGYKNTSKPSKVDTDIQVSGKFYIGLQLDPKISALCGIVEIGVEGELGVEIEVKTRNREDTETERHKCGVCAEGTIYGVFNFKAELKFELWKFEYKQEIQIWDVKLHFLDFYISNQLGLGEGKCPNNEYKHFIYVVDKSNNPIIGASVGSLTTDSKGCVADFYKNGKNTLGVSKSGYVSKEYTFNVEGGVGTHVVTLYKEGESTGITWNPLSSGNVIYKGNNEGTTKVYFYDDKGYGSSAYIYAYTYKYLPAAGVDEELGIWPGEPCRYEGANIWSIDMPNNCTHILFSYNGDTTVEGQTNDIPNPGKTMIAVRGSGYEYNDVGGYHPIYNWEEYNVSTASISMMAELDEVEGANPAIVATSDESKADEPDVQITIKEKVSVGDLVPNGIYAFMMLKGSIGNYTVDTDSLVYITDGFADENGNIEFTYYYEPFDGEWLGVIFGPCNHNEGDWKIINQPTLDGAGIKAQFCTKCSEVLGVAEIPQKNVTAISLYDCPELITGDAEAINDITLRVALDSGEYLYIGGADCTIDGYAPDVSGQQTVAVTYYGFTEYITVNVTDKNEVYRDVYFINIQDWTSVYVYYYGSAYESVEYPGVKMSYVETNSLGQDIYTASVPMDVTLIKFSNSTENVKTVSVALSENIVDYMGWYPTSLGSTGSWNVGEFTYSTVEDNVPATYDEVIGTKTIYFTNSPGWSYVYIYCWSDAGESIVWPGTAMTYVRTNAYSQKIYKAEIPDDITNIIFNNNGYYQTIDITEGVEDGIGFYTTDYLGSYIYDVESYVYDEHSDDIETEPAEEGKIESNVLIKGTFNDWKGSMMYYTDDTSIVTSTMVLEPGTYEFKVYKTDSATWLGNTGIIADTTEATSSSGWTMKATVSANCTLVATGGAYTFHFDTSTNKLIIKHTVVVETEPTEPTESTAATDPVETTVAHELPSVNPAFSGASLTLQDNLCINFKANESLFTEVGYENPYVIFELNGEEFTVSEYEVVEGKYVFDFADIAPHNMNDTVKATLYATFDGVEYVSETREYSVATYCYNMLGKYTTSAYAELQTLLVDLLNYGAMSQVYTGHNTDNLVNANLTDAQKAWGTSETPTYESVQNLAYKTIDNPTVQWKGGGLNLVDAVTMRFKISADSGSYENLVVKAETDDRIWTIPYEEFSETTDGYYVYFSGLNAGEMSETVYLTVYENGEAVSNTLSYSIESYVYSKQSSTDTNLTNLLETMMKYGNSAYAYAN